MRTLADDTLNAAFAALADPTRRAIVSRLARGDATVTELAAPFAMSLPADLQAPQGVGAQRPYLATPRRAVPTLPPGSRLARRRTGLDHDEPAPVGRALRQARHAAGRPAAGREANGACPWLTHGELHFSRVFDAPRELVFALHDRPRPSHPLLGPAGGQRATRDRITVDARPGGVFETVMVNDADGSEYPTRAVYDEVRAARAVGVDRVALGHAGALRVRRARPASAPRSGSTRPTCPRRSWPPRPRPGSCRRSTASTRISPGWSHEHGHERTTSPRSTRRCADLLESARARRVGRHRRCARAGAPARWWPT